MAAALIVFLAALGISMALDVTMILPLLLGAALFTAVAVRRGVPLREVGRRAWASAADSAIVIRVLLLIGCLTGLWRAAGTIPYFVARGAGLLPPRFFLLACFLLCAAMSMALGTAFGVTATCGVILMAMARSGGVDPVSTAGAILAGVFVGDRGAPASSSANLTASLTHTDMRDNLRRMLRTGLIPFLLSASLYAGLSLLHPMGAMDSGLMSAMEGLFRLHWVCLIPAVLILVLPFCGVKILHSIAVSMISALVLGVLWQGNPLRAVLRAMLLGYVCPEAGLSPILSGGGMSSMAEVCVILLISGSYGGILRAAGLLETTDRMMLAARNGLGRYGAMLVSSLVICAVFCNQTIGIIMQSELSAVLYGEEPEERMEKMLDIENSVVVTAPLVPWCIACSVPLGMLGAGPAAVPRAFFLYLLPLYTLLRAAGGKRKVK